MLASEVVDELGLDLSSLRLKFAEVEAYFLEAGRTSNGENRSLKKYQVDVAQVSKALRNVLLSRGGTTHDLRCAVQKLNLGSGTLFVDGSLSELLQWYFPDQVDRIMQQISGRVLSKYSIHEPGTAISVAYLGCANDAQFGYWASSPFGMGRLIRLLEDVFVDEGGVVQTSELITHALWNDDLVRCVVTESGRVFDADYFLFGGTPMEMAKVFKPRFESENARALIEDWQSELHDGGCSKMLVVSNTPLVFRGAGMSDLERSMLVRGLTEYEWREAFSSASEVGHSERPYFEVFGSSVFHGQKSPPYIYSIFVMYSSYSVLASLSDNDRADRKSMLAAHVFESLVNPEDVSKWEIMDPIDLENEFRLTRGNVDHGRFSLGWILEQRRVDLDLLGRCNVVGCGSGFWAGGLVSGLPGYLAARELLELEKESAK
jgi:phytoene dehydrogenase-like protein